MVPSSLTLRNDPKPEGGAVSFSTSSLRAMICSGLPQGGGQAFVLGQGLGELALGLEEAFLEHPDLAGRVLQAAAEQGRLLLEELDLPLQLAGLRRLLWHGVGVATGPRLPGAVGVLRESPSAVVEATDGWLGRLA